MRNANYKKEAPKPAYSCEKCPEGGKAALGVCNNGFGICKENLDYQRLLWELNNTEGD